MAEMHRSYQFTYGNTLRVKYETQLGAISIALEESCRWKLTDGTFITANAEVITGMATAIRKHIQACFDREAELVGQVETAKTAKKLAAIEIAF